MKTSTDFKPVPQFILDSLICHKCYNYLTVLPVGILPDGHSRCGRCETEKHSKKQFCVLEENFKWENVYNIPVALLGYASYNSLFPCVYKYEGCNKYLRLEDVEKHEDNCPHKERNHFYSCPLCGFNGAGIQLLNHFRLWHRKFYKDKATMTLNDKNGYRDVILYLRSDVLLFIEALFEKDASHFSLDMFCISDLSCQGFVKMLFCVDYGSKNECQSLNVLSERLRLVKGRKYRITIQTNDFRLLDSANFICNFQLVNAASV